MGLEVKEKGDSGGVRGRPSLWKSVKVFFRGISRKQGTVKGSGSDKTPRGAGKYAQTGAHLSQNRRQVRPCVAHFLPVCQFPFCLSLSGSYFSSVHLPIFVRRSFFSICRPPFFSSLFLCLLFLPHQYLITLILFMKQTNTCLHIVFLCVPLFFSSSISSVSFISVSPLIHLVEGSKQNLWHGLSRAKYS